MLIISTTKDIGIGEELLMDYKWDFIEKMIKETTHSFNICMCSSLECRFFIQGDLVKSYSNLLKDLVAIPDLQENITLELSQKDLMKFEEIETFAPLICSKFGKIRHYVESIESVFIFNWRFHGKCNHKNQSRKGCCECNEILFTFFNPSHSSQPKYISQWVLDRYRKGAFISFVHSTSKVSTLKLYHSNSMNQFNKTIKNFPEFDQLLQDQETVNRWNQIKSQHIK